MHLGIDSHRFNSMKKAKGKLREAVEVREYREALMQSYDCETIVLTWERIHSLANWHNGFSAKILAGLGVGWPPKQGWLQRLIGTSIPRELFERLQKIKAESGKP